MSLRRKKGEINKFVDNRYGTEMQAFCLWWQQLHKNEFVTLNFVKGVKLRGNEVYDILLNEACGTHTTKFLVKSK